MIGTALERRLSELVFNTFQRKRGIYGNTTPLFFQSELILWLQYKIGSHERVPIDLKQSAVSLLSATPSHIDEQLKNSSKVA